MTESPNLDQIIIQPMLAAHWPEVRAIYLEGIATGNATFETEAPDWETWDADHISAARLVAIGGPEVVGWAALSPVSRRAVYAGVAEVSVYVASRFRGCGVGKMLLQALVQAAEEAGLWTLQAAIFPENQASIAIHRSCGFREVGVRQRIARHHVVWRDTVVLERRSSVVGL